MTGISATVNRVFRARALLMALALDGTLFQMPD
jgi:hypothetical protein